MGKNFVKTYQKFKGINRKDSPLLSNMSEFANCENYIFNGGSNTDSVNPDNVSLVGRVGHQVYTQKCSPIDFIKYSYGSESNGLVTNNEEKVVLGHHLFRVEDRSFTITRTAGDVWFDWQVYLDPSTENYLFQLSEANISVLTINLGTGLEDLPVTVYDIASQVDALANYSVNLAVDFPNHAKVNGNQSPAGTVFTVDAGHGIAAGDTITLYNFNSGNEGLFVFYVLSVTATTITVLDTFETVALLDNQYFCESAVPGVCLGTTVSGAQNANDDNTFTVTYKYLQPVNYAIRGNLPTSQFGYQYGAESFKNRSSFANYRDCLYFLTPTKFLMKYDGQNVYRAGLPMPVIPSLPGAYNGAGALTPSSTYKYAIHYRFIDNRDNIIESAIQYEAAYDPDDNPIYSFDDSTFYPLTISLGASDDSVDFNFVPFLYRFNTVISEPRCNMKGGVSSANYVGVNTIALDGDFASLETNFDVGDKITFKDRSHAAYPLFTSLTTRTVTAVNKATGSVTFDGGTVNLNTGDAVSCGLTMVVYRTKANGSIYYLADEIAVDVYNISLNYDDLVADSNLGIRLIGELDGEERGKPPQMDFIVEHQGCLMGARGSVVKYSLPQEFEAFPADYEIEFPYEGSITGLYSDSEDRLISTKDRALYKTEGDIPGGNYSTATIREGDFGVSGNSSLAKCNGIIYGLGRMGFIGIKDGELLLNSEGDSLIGAYINPEIRRLINGNNFNVAMATNNSIEGHYQCWIPESETPVLYTAEDSAGGRMYTFDYLNGGAWGRKTYRTPEGSPYGRKVIFGNESFFSSRYSSELGVTGHIFRDSHFFDTDVPNRFKYSDNHRSIVYTIETRDEHLGLPSVLKEFIWFKVYAFLPFTDFTMTVTQYLNFIGNAPIIGDPSFQLQFSQDTSDIGRFAKFHSLNLNKAFACSFKMVVDMHQACPIISGIEVGVNDSYLEEQPIA